MLDTTHTAELLTVHFPELLPELQPSGSLSLYQQLHAFARYTRWAATTQQLTRVRECFVVADGFLQTGNGQLVAALKTSYLHGLHLDGSTHDNQLVRQLMPPALYQAYAQLHAGLLP